MNGRMLAANEVDGKRFIAESGDGVEGNLAARRIKPAVVVDEGHVVRVRRLPVELWKKRYIIRAARALPQISRDGPDGIRHLLKISRVIRTVRSGRRAEPARYGILRIRRRQHSARRQRIAV